MAEAAVTFLLRNLKEVLSYHFHLIGDAKHELEQLENELRLPKAFLEGESNRYKDGLSKEYERQIREVVYDVEDAIDSSYTNPNSFSLAENVKSLMVKVKPLIGRHKEFPSMEASSDSNPSAEERYAMRIQALRGKNVVGFEDDTKILISYLTEESNELDVISITGMPGIGKTTLAWKIFRDPRIESEFPTLIWIFFSKDFNTKDVYLTILKKFTKQDMSRKYVDELAPLVSGYLEKEKFLMFIDDVWTTEAWKEIKDVLPESNKESKVLITSRSEKVARHTNRSHKLQLLGEKKSWELLQFEAFRKGVCPKSLEVVGKLIAKECEGHPLAIVVIGGILHDLISRENYMDKWKRVSERVDICISNEDEGKRMEKLISLSYNSLPYDLKICFLYLGIFPKNSEIPAWKLTQLWIAERFIQHKPHKSLEETAYDNLEDLIDRNLVIVDKTKADGSVKTCRVHGTIRQFCINEADEHNLFQEVRMSNEGVMEPQIEKVQKCRRLCIHSYVHDLFLKTKTVPHTRSFLCNSEETINLEKKDIASITNAFELIRVYDVNATKFNDFPTKLSELVHLRYITLSNIEFGVLPKAISKLWNLQTLTVHTSSPTLEVKANIWDMLQLRHVKTKASIILKTRMKGKGGENLRTLSRLSPQSCTENVFNKAKNLMTLGIRGQLDSLLNSTCFQNLKLLEKLKLVHDVFPRVAPENPLRGLPRTFPPNLRSLTLSGTNLDWTLMSAVGNIPNLEVLKLKDKAFRGNRWDAVDGGFLCLEILYIEGSNLQTWTTSGDPFPNLTSLVLKNCQLKLEEVPPYLRDKVSMRNDSPNLQFVLPGN